MADHRWPLEPLLDATGMTVSALADHLNVARIRVYEAEKRGLSDLLADRYAVRCGLHPCLVWTDWFDPYTDAIGVLFARLEMELSA